MKERPIIFSAPMVRAILDGRKTQTRRVVKSETVGDSGEIVPLLGRCPYGQPGDTLYVKETWFSDARVQKASGWEPIIHYRSDCELPVKWRPSIFMPRWASRITLEVTGIRVEKLQDISEEDAKAEGMTLRNPRDISGDHGNAGYLISEFMGLWESINGPGSWDANPWVWIVEFRRVEAKSEAA